MEVKYFKQQRNEELGQIVEADVSDYLEDHYFA
jgi:hypothetical protein